MVGDQVQIAHKSFYSFNSGLFIYLKNFGSVQMVSFSFPSYILNIFLKNFGYEPIRFKSKS